MDQFTLGLIERVNDYINDDLVRFKLIAEQEEDPRSKQEHLAFMKYLVSVAMHPIGLRASVVPFNSSQDHMLAYLMDMFKLTPNDIKSFITGTPTGHQDDEAKALKRHHWRPELRIRIKPPPLSQTLLKNLSIRVYLFKTEQQQLTPPSNTTDKNRGPLHNIFKRFRPESSIVIRSTNELRSLVKFEPVELESKSKSLDYSMIQIDQTQNDHITQHKSNDDISLPIKRYYCKPGSVHVLRFEFWVHIDDQQSNYLNQKCMRLLLCGGDGCFSRRKSIYMNERQEFYGYINIKLTQLPSYPIKSIYPILNLKERKINSCEVCLEPRNRKLSRKGFNDELLVRHLQLYVKCFLYQSLSMKLPPNGHSSITLENLFYLAAYTLINQHRLQSNLTIFEDKCCRRISLILLLIRLEQQQVVINSTSAMVKKILILIAQSEYIIGHRNEEPTTRNEPDEMVRLNVINLEIAVLKEFYFKFLLQRLSLWFLKPLIKGKEDLHERSSTLSGLKLFRVALSHMRRSYRDMDSLQEEVTRLKNSTEQLICKIILNFIGTRLVEITQSYDFPERKKIIRLKNEKIKSHLVISDSWLDLLHQIKSINYDICLYWSRKGLDGLVEKQRDYVRQSSELDRLDKGTFKKDLEAKLEEFLK